MKNIQKKLTMIFELAMLLILTNSAVSYGMKNNKQDEESFEIFRLLPVEIKEKIKCMSPDAINFLKQQPIILTGPNGHTKDIRSIALNDNTMVTGSDDMTAKLWYIINNTFQLLDTTPIETLGYTIYVALDGDKVATAYGNIAKIWCIDNDAFQLLDTTATCTNGHTDYISSIAMNNNMIIMGAIYETTAKIWRINNNNKLQLLDTTPKKFSSDHWVTSVAINGNMAVTRVVGYHPKLWRIENDTFQFLYKLINEENELVFDLKINGNLILTHSKFGYDGKSVNLWHIDNETPQLLDTLISYNKTEITAIALHGNTMATGLANGTAQIWRINNGKFQLLHTLPAGPLYYNCIYSIAINDKMVAASSKSIVKIWPLSLDLEGTSDTNPLVWILYNANIPQLDLIKRAYQATIDKKEFIIDLPEKFNSIEAHESLEQMDGRTYFTFSEHVRKYLRGSLDIRKNNKK